MSKLVYFLGGALTGVVGIVGAAVLHDCLTSKGTPSATFDSSVSGMQLDRDCLEKADEEGAVAESAVDDVAAESA
jgi:hypothetical protein